MYFFLKKEEEKKERKINFVDKVNSEKGKRREKRGGGEGEGSKINKHGSTRSNRAYLRI